MTWLQPTKMLQVAQLRLQGLSWTKAIKQIYGYAKDRPAWVTRSAIEFAVKDYVNVHQKEIGIRPIQIK